MSKLFLLMGIPGSGKSYFITNHINRIYSIIISKAISRDEIRFSLLTENDEYFSKEKEVFKIFVESINNALKEGFDVYADATHLNSASRNKVLRNITVPVDEINCIWMKTPLQIALERNELRKNDGRKYVPPAQIKDMYKRIQKPELDEGFNKIYIIEPDSPTIIITKEEREYE